MYQHIQGKNQLTTTKKAKQKSTISQGGRAHNLISRLTFLTGKYSIHQIKSWGARVIATTSGYR